MASAPSGSTICRSEDPRVSADPSYQVGRFSAVVTRLTSLLRGQTLRVELRLHHKWSRRNQQSSKKARSCSGLGGIR